MTVRVGINGFGRMGRLGFRAGWNNPACEIVHVNEIAGDAACMAHLLEFDSVHGRWDRPVTAGEGAVSYTHLTLPTMRLRCRSRWSPYH